MHTDLELPWVEKYRPETLAQVVGHTDITKRLGSYVKNKSLPSMLFSGPAGTGKTSSAIALARELYGNSFTQNFLELNASVVPETPVLVKKGKTILRTTFAELAEEYFSSESETFVFPSDLKVLSIDSTNQTRFMPVSLISRHHVSEVARIKFDGGSVTTSLNHSVIVLDSFGNLTSKECRYLREGDVLLSFSETMEESETIVDFEPFAPVLANNLRSGTIPNPKVYLNLKQTTIGVDLAWLFGLYLAEGCAGLNNSRKTSGYTIFTLAYPKEEEIAERVCEIFRSRFGIFPKKKIASSGFDRTKYSSIQVQACNTQIAKFFMANFYNSKQSRKYSHSKRVPSFVFSFPTQLKIEFLKGYMGDASGKWGRMVRYSSISRENLIDIAWLCRSCGLDCSFYEGKQKPELRIVWKKSRKSNLKTDAVPAEPFIEAFKREGINYYYFMRHSLYSKKSKIMSKGLLLEFIQNLPFEKRTRFAKLEKILNSGIFAVRVKSIKRKEFNDWVYDFSVPQSEMFYGGTVPVLLHNSDSRGIDVVRGQIKDFARTLSFTSGFKIIFLDESDALTSDAQQALRRTMEKFTKTCRFILSANYSSRIIEPIQSRCVVFRFKPLNAKDVEARLLEIAKKESLKVDENALKAIFYVSQGDMRKAVNVLQAAASLSNSINEESIFNVSSRAKPEEVKQLILVALDGKFSDARKKLDSLLYEHGMSGEDVILQIYRTVVEMTEKEIGSKTKVELIDTIGEYNFRIVEGANERIQLEALIAQFMKYKK